MPTLVLAFDEIMLLSALAPQKPGFSYPLQHLLDRVIPPDEVKKIHGNFSENGLLLQDREGYPHLNGELAVSFSILNHPAEVLHVRAFARSETPRYALCGRKGRWIILTFGKDDSFFAVTYLYNFEDLAKWFSYDLLGQEEFSEPFFPEKNMRLTSLELSVLAVMQGIFKGRVEVKGARLEGEELQVAWEELCSPDNWINAQRVLPYELDAGKFAALFEDRALVRATAESLAQKNILELDAGGVAFTPLARTIFDPGKVMNMLVCTKTGLINQHKTLQVYAGGWLLLRPLMRERGQVELQLLPGSLSGEEMFYHIMDWEKNLLSSLPVEVAPAAVTEGGPGQADEVVASAREEGWYLYLQEQQYGPYSWLQLQQFAREGRLQLDTMLWHGELPGWTQAAEIEGLFQ